MNIIKISPKPTVEDLKSEFLPSGSAPSNEADIARAFGIANPVEDVLSKAGLNDHLESLEAKVERSGINPDGELKKSMDTARKVLIEKQQAKATAYLDNWKSQLESVLKGTMAPEVLFGSPTSAEELIQNKDQIIGSLGAAKEYLLQELKTPKKDNSDLAKVQASNAKAERDNQAMSAEVHGVISGLHTLYEGLFAGFGTARPPLPTPPAMHDSTDRIFELLGELATANSTSTLSSLYHWANVAPLNKSELEAMDEPSRKALDQLIRDGLKDSFKSVQALTDAFSSGAMSSSELSALLGRAERSGLVSIDPATPAGAAKDQMALQQFLNQLDGLSTFLNWLQGTAIGTHTQRIQTATDRPAALEWLHEKEALLADYEAKLAAVTPHKAALEAISVMEREYNQRKDDLSEKEKAEFKERIHKARKPFRNCLLELRDASCALIGVEVGHFHSTTGILYTKNPNTQGKDPECRETTIDYASQIAVAATLREARKHQLMARDLNPAFNKIIEKQERFDLHTSRWASKLDQALESACDMAYHCQVREEDRSTDISAARMATGSLFDGLKSIGGWFAKSAIGLGGGYALYKFVESKFFTFVNKETSEFYVTSGANILWYAIPIACFSLAHLVPFLYNKFRKR